MLAYLTTTPNPSLSKLKFRKPLKKRFLLSVAIQNVAIMWYYLTMVKQKAPQLCRAYIFYGWNVKY